MTLDASLFLTTTMKVTRDTRVRERIHLVEDKLLQIDTEVTDPNIFVEPYTYSLKFVGGLREEDFVVQCHSANRDMEETLDLTPPPEY